MGGQVQIQQQTERQLLKLTPQQLLNARLVELPIVELEDRVKTELLDNVALEEGHDSDVSSADMDTDMTAGETSVSETERTDSMYDEEDIPVYTSRSVPNEDSERPVGDTKSFLDYLYGQINDFDVTDVQQIIIEILIGSLNENGFIDRSIEGISDDLLFKFNIDATDAEIEESIRILQKFDPPGIGARNLQECLLIQIDRLLGDTDEADAARRSMLMLEHDIIQQHFENFKHKRIQTISHALGVDEALVGKAFDGISRLNPRPGLALSESADHGYQAIVPDFIIETTPDGGISIELNSGEVPELRVSKDYAEQLKHYQSAGSKLSRSQSEAYEYTRMKVEGARMFIESIRQRQRTMMATMQAIVRLQRDFILSQDESVLRPMRLVDVAELTKLDISTISRVRKGKYVQIDGQVYPLDFFFLRSRTNAEGEALQHKEVKQELQSIIESEDRRNPYPDQTLVEMLKAKGLNISRRTVAKYRAELGIASAQKRQEF